MQDTHAWPDDIFAVLKSLEARVIAYVPDAGHARLIDRCRAEPSMIAVPLTTEEEGIALLAGAWLGGARGALLMQSSGAGNCINMLSLARACRFPLLIVATMRGEEGETNPWQVPMGQIIGDVLGLAGAAVSRVDQAGEAGSAVEQAGRAAFDDASAAAVLIGQQIIGIKSFDKPHTSGDGQ